jgi:hypothetical protein
VLNEIFVLWLLILLYSKIDSYNINIMYDASRVIDIRRSFQNSVKTVTKYLGDALIRHHCGFLYHHSEKKKKLMFVFLRARYLTKRNSSLATPVCERFSHKAMILICVRP